jgi:two-component system NtrC family sensor kinase
MTSQVLIVDREAEFRSELCGELQRAGYAVLQAADGETAIDCVEHVPLDLIVADTELPGLSGLDLLRLVRRQSPGTEVVLSTQGSTLEDTVRAFRAGAFDVLRRPFDLPQLMVSVNRALEMHKLRSMRSFYEAGQALFSLKEPERLAEVIVDLVSSVMEADVVSLMLPDAAGHLYIAHSRGLPRPLRASVRLPLGDRIAGRVAESRQPILLREKLARDDRFSHLESHGRVSSSIVYPLVAADHLLGIVNIGRTSDTHLFGPPDLERAGVVASQIILALNNHRLWRQISMSERLATIGQIAASVVHEINNPLSVVIGQTYNAQCLLEDITSDLKREKVSSPKIEATLDELRSALSESENAATRISAIATDVRTAVRQSEGGDGILDINDAIRAAIRLASAALRKSAQVDQSLDADLLVRGDQGRLCQVFLNMLLNAAQALKAFPVTLPKIRLVSSREGAEVRIDVSDNGPGISAENIARIFEPFFTTKGPDAGTGLGLAISAEIVQRHGGRIEVQSVEGEGTRFTVYLPALAPEPAGHS